MIHQILTLLHGLSSLPVSEPMAPCITLSDATNPYTWLPEVLAGLTVLFFSVGLAAALLSTRASLPRFIRRLILWPFLLATGGALLGIAWGWELSNTFNDSGCLVYVQSAPFDQESISLVIAVLLIGLLAALAVYGALDIYLVIHRLLSRRSVA